MPNKKPVAPIKKAQPEPNDARRALIGQAKRSKTRAVLLEAALNALGHEAGRFATIDDVLARAEVSRGTFYNHFSGREQLLEAVSTELNRRFDIALDRSLEDRPYQDERACVWIRHYLRRVALDRRWGWALVNVSLSGFALMGGHVYGIAFRNLTEGSEKGVFRVRHLESALSIALGGVMSAAIAILRETRSDEFPEGAAYAALLALGVPSRRAKTLVERPLPEVDYDLSMGASAPDRARSARHNPT